MNFVQKQTSAFISLILAQKDIKVNSQYLQKKILNIVLFAQSEFCNLPILTKCFQNVHFNAKSALYGIFVQLALPHILGKHFFVYVIDDRRLFSAPFGS